MGTKLGVAEEQLREVILGQYKSVRAFCEACGLPYSTVDNVLRRGVTTVTANTVAVLCGSLGLDCARFIGGEILPASGGTPAPGWEQTLVERCRGLDAHGRALVELVAGKEQERCNNAGVAVLFQAKKRNESWRQYVGAPIACRGGGVTVASEEDARQMEQIYRKLMGGKGE